MRVLPVHGNDPVRQRVHAWQALGFSKQHHNFLMHALLTCHYVAGFQASGFAAALYIPSTEVHHHGIECKVSGGYALALATSGGDIGDIFPQ